MHPREFWWAIEGYQEKHNAERGKTGKLTEDEVAEMKDDLRRKRVAKGYPPE